MPKHTPGPWHPGFDEAGRPTLSVVSMEQVEPIARVTPGDCAEANRALIVAAPALLAFARKVACYADGEVGNPALLVRFLSEEAQALIGKAEGCS